MSHIDHVSSESVEIKSRFLKLSRTNFLVKDFFFCHELDFIPKNEILSSYIENSELIMRNKSGGVK